MNLSKKPADAEVPVALTIAGSDNSAGAGIQADLKTFGAMGVYGLTAVTCVVAEVPGHVSMVHPVPRDVVREQVRLLFGAYPIRAVKTGMLYSCELIEAVADELAKLDPLPILVIDPVMVASSGDPLLEPDAIAAYRELLFPMATLITPNLDEATVLLGEPICDEAAMRRAGQELAGQFNLAVLMKGGHLRAAEAVDFLVAGEYIHEYRTPYIPGVSTHGTGCTYSAAITAQLAWGKALPQAIDIAKLFVTSSVKNCHRWWVGGGETVALGFNSP